MNYMKYILYSLTLLVSTFSQAQTLDEFILEASENNPSLLSKYALFEASLQRVAQANSLPDPILSFGYFISPVETKLGPQKAKLSLSQMFPWFGVLSLKEDIATQEAQAKYHQFLDAQLALTYKVKSAWYPIRETQDVILIQMEYLELLETLKELSTISFKNGKSEMVDVVRVNILISETKTQIELLKSLIIPLKSSLANLLGRSSGEDIVVSETQYSVTDELELRYSKTEVLSHPSLMVYEYMYASSTSKIDLAQKLTKPSIGIGVDYVFVNEITELSIPDNGRDVFMPMLSMNVPIFRKSYRAAQQESVFLSNSIELASDSKKNELLSSYDMAHYKLLKSKDLLSLYSEQIDSSNRAFTLLLASYSNDYSGFEEVLRMKQDLLRFEIAQKQASTEFFIALAQLDYLTSKSISK
ncbi:MAG: transporter [Bacteroidetes bacterium]|nr:MAG: transporter [Bacteroidota bacterium]